jgi:hypothetical protein
MVAAVGPDPDAPYCGSGTHRLKHIQLFTSFNSGTNRIAVRVQETAAVYHESGSYIYRICHILIILVSVIKIENKYPSLLCFTQEKIFPVINNKKGQITFTHFIDMNTVINANIKLYYNCLVMASTGEPDDYVDSDDDQQQLQMPPKDQVEALLREEEEEKMEVDPGTAESGAATPPPANTTAGDGNMMPPPPPPSGTAPASAGGTAATPEVSTPAAAETAVTADVTAAGTPPARAAQSLAVTPPAHPAQTRPEAPAAPQALLGKYNCQRYTKTLKLLG